MSEKEIDAIDDIVEMGRMMTSLGISSKGLRTLDEMKLRVKETLRLSKKKSSWTAKEVRFSWFGSTSTELKFDTINFGLGTGPKTRH